jgi:hypothetical protein
MKTNDVLIFYILNMYEKNLEIAIFWNEGSTPHATSPSTGTIYLLPPYWY